MKSLVAMLILLSSCSKNAIPSKAVVKDNNTKTVTTTKDRNIVILTFVLGFALTTHFFEDDRH